MVVDSSCNMFSISLLNVRSLRKHSIDIKYDLRPFKSDILASTETQLLFQESNNDIVSNIPSLCIVKTIVLTNILVWLYAQEIQQK